MTTTNQERAPRPYLFDNDKPTAPDLLTHLATILDDFTRSQVLQAGLAPGSRCLDLGAGRGSMSAWMADQVGPDGRVVAADLKPQHVREHPGVEVVACDVINDELPEGPFDIILARLLLGWLPQRYDVLAAAVTRLAPGGAMVVVEWESGWDRALLAPDNAEHKALFGRYHAAFAESMRRRGHDLGWCRKVLGAMRDAGLVDVQSTTNSRSWPAGTAGAELPVFTSTEARESLVAAGMSTEDIDELHRVLRDPATVIQGINTWATVGHRPH